MADLTLPGSIPGLLRRGAPVLARGKPSVVVYVDGLHVGVARDFSRARFDWVNVARHVALDLSDPIGAALATWWLGDKLGVSKRFSMVGPHVWPVDDRVKPPILGFTIGLGVVYLSKPAPARSNHERSEVLPALSAIDLASPTADIEALRAVVLHLAGLAE